MAHDIEHLAPAREQHTFRCRCGATCEPKKTRQMAEDEARKHLDLIARITKPRTCTLDTEYRHAKEMAENPDVSQADRFLWEQMADELGKRLGLEAPPSVQDQLFTL